MTMILDPKHPWSWSAQLEGDAALSMAPEVLVPGKFGFAESVPMQELDVNALKLVIYQVRNRNPGRLSCAHAIQALAGEVPFHGLHMGEMPAGMVEGELSPTPKDASDLVLSGPLWDSAQFCWDSEFALQPKITGVVSQLGEAGATRNGVVALPDFMTYCEFHILIAP